MTAAVVQLRIGGDERVSSIGHHSSGARTIELSPALSLLHACGAAMAARVRRSCSGRPGAFTRTYVLHCTEQACSKPCQQSVPGLTLLYLSSYS